MIIIPATHSFSAHLLLAVCLVGMKTKNKLCNCGKGWVLCHISMAFKLDSF